MQGAREMRNETYVVVRRSDEERSGMQQTDGKFNKTVTLP